MHVVLNRDGVEYHFAPIPDIDVKGAAKALGLAHGPAVAEAIKADVVPSERADVATVAAIAAKPADGAAPVPRWNTTAAETALADATIVATKATDVATIRGISDAQTVVTSKTVTTSQSSTAESSTTTRTEKTVTATSSTSTARTTLAEYLASLKTNANSKG